MADLAYDFRVLHAGTVKSALRQVERAAIASSKRIMRQHGLTGATARRAGAATSPAGAQMAARKAATDPAVALQKAQAKGHLVRLRQIEKEKAAGVRAANAEYRARQRQQERLAARKVRDEQRAALVAQRSAQRTAAARGMTRAGMYGTAGRSAVGAARGIGRFALLGGGLMGGFAAAGAIGHAKRVERSAALLANQAFREGSGPSRKEWRQRVTGTARKLGVETGLGAEGVVGGLRQFTAISGNVGAGLELAPLMTKLAVATGADVGDVGRTGGQIMQAMQAKNIPQAEAIKQTAEIFRSMAGQAKIGSIEFKDLSTQMGSLISSTSRFEGEVADTVKTMGAIGQLAIAGGASSPEEAMTAVKRFSDDLVQNSHRFEQMAKGAGYKGTFFTDKGKTQLKGPESVLLDVLKVSRGDLTKVKKIFGIRAQKAVEPLQQIYTKERAKGKTEAQAFAATKSKLAEFKEARMSPKEVMQSFNAVMQTSSAKFEVAAEKFNQAVGDRLLPVLTQIIPHFERLIPHLAKAAEYLGRFIKELAENPISTVLKVIAAKMIADVVAARIGASIKDAIVRSFTRVPPGAPPVYGPSGQRPGPGGVITPGVAPGARGAPPPMYGPTGQRPGPGGKMRGGGSRLQRVGGAVRRGAGGTVRAAPAGLMAFFGAALATEQIAELAQESTGGKVSPLALIPGFTLSGRLSPGEAWEKGHLSKAYNAIFGPQTREVAKAGTPEEYERDIAKWKPPPGSAAPAAGATAAAPGLSENTSSTAENTAALNANTVAVLSTGGGAVPNRTNASSNSPASPWY